MLVFLSWSGPRSKAIAEALQHWLAQVIQAVDPWLSQDIEKGTRWGPEIAHRLEASRVGIICLTPENLANPWILFEAGALSKTKDAYVCTLLLDLSPADVAPPLGQFQHTLLAREDVSRLVRTINRLVGECGLKSVAEGSLDEIIDLYWPRLDEAIRRARALPSVQAPQARTDSDLLREALTLIRQQSDTLALLFRRLRLGPPPRIPPRTLDLSPALTSQSTRLTAQQIGDAVAVALRQEPLPLRSGAPASEQDEPPIPDETSSA